VAEMTVFEYQKKNSFLHRRDVRFKLACFVLLTVSSLAAGFEALFLLLLIPVFFMIRLRISFVSAFKELKYFFLLLLFVFCARVLSTPGHTLVSFEYFEITRQGLISGSLICLRLVITVLMGLIFVRSTKAADIRDAVEWMLAPVPFIPEKRAATMIGLLVRFLPVIIMQAKITVNAQRARCVENRKNPVYRLTVLTVPFMRRVFNTADRLALAMEARCYSEDRTGSEFSSNQLDWALLFISSFLFFLFIYGF
jgi:energy-coupling factor transporter transmembrane protein EcfT